MHRSIKAFLIAPLVPALLFVVCISGAGLVFSDSSLAPAIAYSAPVWLMFAAPVSYVVAVVLGVPGFLLFRRLGWLTVHGLVGGASALGLLVGAVFAIPFASDSLLSIAATALSFSVFGAAAGLAFWWVWRPQAPNNSLQGRRP